MKRCEYCGKYMVKKPTWSNHYFERKRFCDKECYAAFLRKSARREEGERTKPCLFCGKEFTRSTFRNGTKESWPKWETRKYCSLKCRDEMSRLAKPEPVPEPKKKINPRLEYDDAWAIVRWLANNEKTRKGRVNIIGKVAAKTREQMWRIDEAEIRRQYGTRVWE